MTREQAISELIGWQAPNADTEIAHSEADKILCQFLTALGYADVVGEWEKVSKWYA